MSPDAARLLDEALALSEDERTELIIRLLDMMRDKFEPASSNDSSGGRNVPMEPVRDSAVIEAAWIEEARRRLQEIKAGHVEPAPWTQARERIFAHEP